MTIDLFRSLSPLRWARVLSAFVRAVKTPDVPHFYELESATWELASPRQLERMAERFRASPDMKHAFEERYFPRTRTVEEASRCAEGTFGRAYFDFMTRNNLSVDYLEARTLEGDLTWFRARQAQAHDQWHTLLGIDPQYGGEVEIVAVLLAQFRRALPNEPLASGFTALMLVVYLTHAALTNLKALPSLLRRARTGYRRGWSTAPLWGLHFEALWDLPLVELQRSVVVGTEAPPRIEAGALLNRARFSAE